MEQSQDYSQLPKQLQLYYARIQCVQYPTVISVFCAKVKEFYRLLEEKFKLQENQLEKRTVQKMSAEMVAFREAIRCAEVTFNDRNLEMLCRCLVAQEASNDAMTQFMIVNLNAILYKVDHGEISIHIRGIQTHDAIAQQFETTQQELQKKTESVKLLEARIKNRDEVWQKAFEQLKVHYDAAQHSNQELFTKTLNQLMQQNAILHQQQYETNLKSYEATLQRLDAKDQQIALLTEQNYLLLKCAFSLEDATHLASPKSPTNENNPCSPKKSPYKLSHALGKSLARRITPDPTSPARKLNFTTESVSSHATPHPPVPDFDELAQRFDSIKTNGN